MANQDQYTTFGVLDFAQDPWFIQWVQGSSEEAVRFWASWLAEHPEKAATVAEARLLVKSIRIAEEKPSRQQIDRLWEKIETAVSEEEARPAPVRPLLISWRVAIAAAASVAVLLTAYFLLFSSRQTVRIDPGEQLTYYLPDSSRIELNAASTIRWDNRKWKNERRVVLDGEAFFDVREGISFTVVTPKGEVEVLGTSFNVDAYGGDFQVDCFTGRVQVRTRTGDQRVILQPGQGARLDPASGKLNTYMFEPQEQAGWRKGIIYYKNNTLKEVFAELERQFDVRIESRPEIETEVTTGFFQLNRLDSALHSVCWPMKLRFTIEGKQVFIEREEKE